MKTALRALMSAALVVTGASAFAHARVLNSNPATGATLSAPPTELRIQYNEPVEAAASAVKVIGPGDVELAAEKVIADKDDAKSLVLGLPKLGAGDYRAEWSTVGRDGHRTKGEIRFTVK